MGSYDPFQPGRRPGGKPDRKPKYRVLVHRQMLNRWNELVERVGVAQAQKFYDHVSSTPGIPAEGIRSSQLRGSQGLPIANGFSRTIHWRVPGQAARIDYQHNDNYSDGEDGDEHPVVMVLSINYSSH